ncbi:hypothetical protein ACLOJK_021434 [Asimina triloba]
MATDLDSLKYEDGEVAGLEYGSPERLYKEDKAIDFEAEKMDLEENAPDAENGDGHDDGDISLNKDREKSRESGKHRNKDRRKGKREEKDQKSKERERLKERDKAHDASKEKANREPETRDKDHISSWERRKEEIEVHKDKERNKDKFREKDYDRNKHKDKDRERNEGREREHERGKDSVKDRERDREMEKEHSVEKDYERGKERGRDRDREMEKERSVERDYEHGKERGRERDRDAEKERSVERDYERGKKRGRERDRDMEKEHSVERDYERGKERGREKEKDNEKSKGRDRDWEKVDREWDRDRVKEKDREREKERDRTKEREREREEGKDWEKEREKERDKGWDRSEREKVKEKFKKEKDKERDKYWEKDRDKERGKDKGRDKVSGKNRDEGYEISRGKEREKDEHLKVNYEDSRDEDKDIQNRMIDAQERVGSKDEKLITERVSDASQPSISELQDRIRKMKEERLKKKSDGVSEVLAWVNKSRILEEKRNAEKEKALLLSKVFEEQDNIDQGDSEEEEGPQHTGRDLGGVKILHGLDKVMEGGAVVLTLKDQNILADGDINEEVDMLENAEISEQKQRDGAYNAAKKKTGIYTDKFSDDPGSQRKILPQYDDPVEDEGVTLDESGHFSGEAEKKLEELRKRIQGGNSSKHFDDLASTAKGSSDYYTQEEMLQFKKPKKKKSLRKREKLDLDALEAEAKSAGLGVGDLGSRNEGKRQLARAEQEKADAEMRSNAYQAAYARAEEASKALRHEQTLTVKDEEDGNLVFGDEDEDLYRSLDQARKLALKKQAEKAASGPQAIALLAVAEKDTEDSQNPHFGDPQEKRLVFTEMEEFVSKIKLDEDAHKPETEDVFEEEDEPKSLDKEQDEGGGWMEVNENENDELPVEVERDEPVPDTTTHEPAVGKGLSGALQLLKERGTLKETVDWGGRNMDKKKSKLVGIYDEDRTKEIRIERTDEFGRIMTPKEAFRMISHKFHGKGPGKMKLEKRQKQFFEELKLKQMKASDTPLLSMERMREAQAQTKSPYLVLSGHVKPGQTSDPRSGFATVEKDHPGSLTPMLGDRKSTVFEGQLCASLSNEQLFTLPLRSLLGHHGQLLERSFSIEDAVEHFLGLKRKAEPTDMGPPKKPKI